MRCRGLVYAVCGFSGTGAAGGVGNAFNMPTPVFAWRRFRCSLPGGSSTCITKFVQLWLWAKVEMGCSGSGFKVKGGHRREGCEVAWETGGTNIVVMKPDMALDCAVSDIRSRVVRALQHIPVVSMAIRIQQGNRECTYACLCLPVLAQQGVTEVGKEEKDLEQR